MKDLWSARLVTAVTVAGELRYGASISERRRENLAAVDEFLDGIAQLPITTAVASRYGTLKAALFERFAPRERPKRRRFELASLGFHDNDLWIAACALDAEMTLVTSDGDFDRMTEVSDLIVESWISEDEVKLEDQWGGKSMRPDDEPFPSARRNAGAPSF